MLRAHLEDGTLLAAKAWSHARADTRHVAYAIALHFRERPDVGELLPEAKRALDPRGNAIEVPSLTEEAASVLAAIGSDQDALAALRRLLGDDPGDSGAVASSGDGSGDASVAVATAIESPSPVSGDSASTETIEDVLAELDRLVGLEKVKEQVRTVIAVVQANRAREEAGLATVSPGLHLVFTGPPGTGKTTVARLIARLYAASGAIQGAKFTEVDRSDLVAGYVGQTAIKTAAIIERTVPGVLFIDEAYALTPTHASDFGAEAIATLVKAMEDRRHELAIIVAGYRDEMAEFVESNPGLSSRLKTFIDFPAYAPDELAQIFSSLVNATGLHLPSEALEKAKALFEQAGGRADLGNARFARSLFEQAYARMARRAAADGDVELDELNAFVPEDLEWSEPIIVDRPGRIGFRDDPIADAAGEVG